MIVGDELQVDNIRLEETIVLGDETIQTRTESHFFVNQNYQGRALYDTENRPVFIELTNNEYTFFYVFPKHKRQSIIPGKEIFLRFLDNRYDYFNLLNNWNAGLKKVTLAPLKRSPTEPGRILHTLLSSNFGSRYEDTALFLVENHCGGPSVAYCLAPIVSAHAAIVKEYFFSPNNEERLRKYAGLLRSSNITGVLGKLDEYSKEIIKSAKKHMQELELFINVLQIKSIRKKFREQKEKTEKAIDYIEKNLDEIVLKLLEPMNTDTYYMSLSEILPFHAAVATPVALKQVVMNDVL